jgi:hypothetical protein
VPLDGGLRETGCSNASTCDQETPPIRLLYKLIWQQFFLACSGVERETLRDEFAIARSEQSCAMELWLMRCQAALESAPSSTAQPMPLNFEDVLASRKHQCRAVYCWLVRSKVTATVCLRSGLFTSLTRICSGVLQISFPFLEPRRG